MVSLWGSKKDDDSESGRALIEEEGNDNVAQSRLSESNERTRLLPPPAATGREGFLDPDDPAVSPPCYA